MKLFKNLFLVALSIGVLASCNKDDDNNTSRVNVALKTTTTQLKNAGTPEVSPVDLTMFKLSIAEIEFDLTDDLEDQTTPEDKPYTDIELEGPFVVDLKDAKSEAVVENTGIDLTSANVPNAVYEEIEFDIEPYQGTEHEDMVGKTFIVKGTFNNDNFIIEGSKELEFEIDYPKGYTLDGTTSKLFIDLQLGKLIETVVKIDFANTVREEDGTILVNKDKNTEYLEAIEKVLEDSFEVEEDGDDDEEEVKK